MHGITGGQTTIRTPQEKIAAAEAKVARLEGLFAAGGSALKKAQRELRTLRRENPGAVPPAATPAPTFSADATADAAGRDGSEFVHVDSEGVARADETAAPASPAAPDAPISPIPLAAATPSAPLASALAAETPPAAAIEHAAQDAAPPAPPAAHTEATAAPAQGWRFLGWFSGWFGRAPASTSAPTTQV